MRLLSSVWITRPLVLFFIFAHSAAWSADRIVFISDSHGVGEYGVEINRWLRNRTQTDFEFFASGGSAPLQWRNGIFTSRCAFSDRSSQPSQPAKGCKVLRTPPLVELLKTNTPHTRKIVLISLGTNMSRKTTDFENEIRWAKNLIHDATLNQTKCIWIGPPQMSRFTSSEIEQMYRMIEEAIDRESKILNTEPCALIDSRKNSHYPKSLTEPRKNPDGIHFDIPGTPYSEGLQAAKSWGIATHAEIEAILARRP